MYYRIMLCILNISAYNAEAGVRRLGKKSGLPAGVYKYLEGYQVKKEDIKLPPRQT
jgi:hypothetical protein